ncbi:MAG: hypothetical protein AABY51_09545 [Deltaproteobacteria bacterium]
MHQIDERRVDESGDGLINGYNTDASRVTFLPEQQTKVQELIDEAYRKAYSKALKTRGSSDEVERLRTEVDRLKQDKKTALILRAAARHNVVDPEEVADLLKERVRMDDDGGLSVVGEGGSVRINGAGVPMSVDEYVNDWLNARPHHLRASGTSGAGSHGTRFAAGANRHNLTDPNAWRTMSRDDLDRLLKDGVNVQGAAGQSYSFKNVKNPFLEARRRKHTSASQANG